MSLNANPKINFVKSGNGSTVRSGDGSPVVSGFNQQKRDFAKNADRLSGGVTSGLSFEADGPAGSGFAPNSAQTIPTGGVTTASEAADAIQNASFELTGAFESVGAGGFASGIRDIAGAVSNLAGNLNDVLSLKRGLNLPSGAELFTQEGQSIKIQPRSSNDWRVKINCDWSRFQSPLFERLASTGGVVWPYQPQVEISTSANYTQIDPVHTNYPFYAYKNSQVDDIRISGEYSAETESDAAYWIGVNQFFKTVTKMFYGQGENVGNPPLICTLSGYGESVFNNIPVVIKNYSVTMPDDVNYVKCEAFGTDTWVPILSTISVSVVPVYNRRDLRKFSLQQYAQGQMTNGNNQGYF